MDSITDKRIEIPMKEKNKLIVEPIIIKLRNLLCKN